MAKLMYSNGSRPGNCRTLTSSLLPIPAEIEEHASPLLRIEPTILTLKTVGLRVLIVTIATFQYLSARPCITALPDKLLFVQRLHFNGIGVADAFKKSFAP